MDLDPSQQGEVKQGDRAQITLPGNTSVTGKVDRLGRVAQVPAGQDGKRRGRDHPGLHQPRRPGEGTRARPGPGPGGHHDQGSGERPERPGHRARREVRRRVRGRGRARRRATRAGRGEAGPVRHRRRTRPGRGRSSRRRSTWWCRRCERRIGSGAGRGDQGLRRAAAGARPPRRVLLRPAGRAGGDRRALRVGQVHAPARHGDAGAAQQRRGPDRWGRRGAAERPRAVAAAGPGDRVRLPAVLPGRARHGARERRRRVALRRRPRRRAVPARG